MSENNEKSALLPKGNKVRRRSRNHSFTQDLYVEFSSLLSGSSDQRSINERGYLTVPEPEKLVPRVRILSTQSGILISELEVNTNKKYWKYYRYYRVSPKKFGLSPFLSF